MSASYKIIIDQLHNYKAISVGAEGNDTLFSCFFLCPR